jgi:hypothetical protein
MFRRAADWWEHNPNAYLAVMALYAAAPIVRLALLGHGLVALALFGAFAALVLVILVLPFEGAQERERMAHFERRYRLAHVVGYPVLIVTLAAISAAWPELGMRPWPGLIMVGGFCALNIARHFRYRGLAKPEAGKA